MREELRTAQGLDELDVVALTIGHEAKGEGRADVASVLMNRLALGIWGTTYRAVCLAPWQFSCWRHAGGVENNNSLKRNAARILAGQRPPSLHSAYTLAFALLAKQHLDTVEGAEYYYAPAAMPPGEIPAWSRGEIAVVKRAGHQFYRLHTRRASTPPPEARPLMNATAVSLRTVENPHYLRMYASGAVAADAVEVGELDEWWNVEHVEGAPGVVRLVSAVHRRYLSAFSDEYCDQIGVPRHSVGSAEFGDIWENWRVIAHGSGLAFQSHWGLWLSPQGGGGGVVLADGPAPAGWEQLIPSDFAPFHVEPAPVPGPNPGTVRPLVGPVRRTGKCYGDDTGARIHHGCSDFAALVKHHEDKPRSLRQLDVVMRHQQFIRVLWRLNGWLWTPSGLTVDPGRDPWFEETARDYFQACHERGIRLSLASGDLNNWSRAQAEAAYAHVGQIAASISPTLVCSAAVVNELRGTMHGGESPENIQWCAHLADIWLRNYPWAMMGISDPDDRSRTGMLKLSVPPANQALIHDQRAPAADAIRHAFNTPHENWPGMPIDQEEPAGPSGTNPGVPFWGHVSGAIENRHELLALYTMHILTGQRSTYFNDPALVSRQPLESTWGFMELAAAWRAMDIPEDIGLGTTHNGLDPASPVDVEGSHAARADSVVHAGRGWTIISGQWDPGDWRVRARWNAETVVYNADGAQWHGHLSPGQVIPVNGPDPVVVRFTP